MYVCATAPNSRGYKLYDKIMKKIQGKGGRASRTPPLATPLTEDKLEAEWRQSGRLGFTWIFARTLVVASRQRRSQLLPTALAGRYCDRSCPSDRLLPLHLWYQLTFDLDFCTCMGNYRSLQMIESRCRRSRSKVWVSKDGNAVCLILILDRVQFV